MSSIVPTTAAEHLPAPGDDAAESERLHRNLTPAIAELGEASHFLRYAVGALAAMLVLHALVFAFNAIVGARFPQGKLTYIWFLDYQLATNGINPQFAEDPRSRAYLGNRSVSFSLADVGTYVGWEATKESFRVVKSCLEGRCQGRLQYD